MTKKILAGVLAGVSMLSLSVAASAATTPTVSDTSAVQGPTTINGISYDVSADLSFGEVDCVVPAVEALGVDGAVVVNPYGAAITSTFSGTDVVNTSFVASKVFEVKNNDTKNGLKVLTTVSVKKATGLVIVDGNAKEPEGWATAVDKNGKTVRVDLKDADGNDITNSVGTVFNPLVSYDKIALTYKDKEKTQLDKAVGGAVSAKQAMNTAVYVAGGTTAADLVAAYDTNGKLPTGVNRVDFAAKGTNGGTLLVLDKKGGTAADGYFTIRGDLNPQINTETYAWAKENLSLSIVLKLIPQVTP